MSSDNNQPDKEKEEFLSLHVTPAPDEVKELFFPFTKGEVTARQLRRDVLARMLNPPEGSLQGATAFYKKELGYDKFDSKPALRWVNRDDFMPCKIPPPTPRNTMGSCHFLDREGKMVRVSGDLAKTEVIENSPKWWDIYEPILAPVFSPLVRGQQLMKAVQRMFDEDDPDTKHRESLKYTCIDFREYPKLPDSEEAAKTIQRWWRGFEEEEEEEKAKVIADREVGQLWHAYFSWFMEQQGVTVFTTGGRAAQQDPEMTKAVDGMLRKLKEQDEEAGALTALLAARLEIDPQTNHYLVGSSEEEEEVDALADIENEEQNNVNGGTEGY